MTRFLAITCVKDEGAGLLDWLAHHRAVGFTDFLVFSNDCRDGTDRMLDRMQDLGLLTHLPNPGPWPKGPQWAALRRADDHPLRVVADWVMFLDVDEYVNIHTGARRLPDLLAALPGATAIPLTWRMFGNAGVIGANDRPVTETFTRCAPAVLHWPWRALMFKTLFRNDGTYGRLGVHRPRAPDQSRLPDARWVDGSGTPLGGAYLTSRVFSDLGRDPYGLVQLNHYALGSMEDYILKCDRGRANRAAAGFDMGYWVERNFSACEDRSILQLDSGAERAALLADPVLAGLLAAARDWRRARFQTMMQEEEVRALFGRLMLTPPSRVLTAEEARQIWAQGRPSPG